jgi:hypothetical protein
VIVVDGRAFDAERLDGPPADGVEELGERQGAVQVADDLQEHLVVRRLLGARARRSDVGDLLGGHRPDRRREPELGRRRGVHLDREEAMQRVVLAQRYRDVRPYAEPPGPGRRQRGRGRDRIDEIRAPQAGVQVAGVEAADAPASGEPGRPAPVQDECRRPPRPERDCEPPRIRRNVASSSGAGCCGGADGGAAPPRLPAPSS